MRRALAVLLSFTACGPSLGEAPPTSGGQRSVDFHGGVWLPELYVLVVDDLPYPDSAELRAEVVSSVRAGMEHDVADRWGLCGSPDPAAWHTADIRFVLARPSAPDDEALSTPLTDPSLAATTNTLAPDAGDGLADGVAMALQDRLAQDGESYRPLRAAKRVVELIAGSRAAATQAEADFVASLPERYLLRVGVFSTENDMDTSAIADLAWNVPDDWAGTHSFTSVLMAPFGTPAWGCEVDAAQGTRFGAWAKAVGAKPLHYPCDDASTWHELFVLGVADCVPWCFPSVIDVEPDGSASCRLSIDQKNLAECDAARGWRDPKDGPTLVDHYGTPLRRCEITQLADKALDACRHSLDCPGCPNGWCLTEVPELVSAESCAPGANPFPFRFVGGALDPDGWLHVRCDTR